MMTFYVIVCIQPVFDLVYWKQKGNEINKNSGLISKKRGIFPYIKQDTSLCKLDFMSTDKDSTLAALIILKMICILQCHNSFCHSTIKYSIFFLLLNCLIVEIIFH